MSILLEENKQYNIITIKGNFDAGTVVNIRDLFTQLAESNDKNVLIDLSNVEFIDSSGIGAIVFLYKRLRSGNFELVLDGLRKQPYELLHLLNIDKIIETHPYQVN